MTTHLKHLPKGLGKYLWWVWNFRVSCESQEAGFVIRDAHFHEKDTKGHPHTGPSSEIILGSSESLIDLINSHLLAATLCQELRWGQECTIPLFPFQSVRVLLCTSCRCRLLRE